MLIINGGLPRSGTVLVGNLIRLMLEDQGLPWKRYNPQEPRHLPAFLRVVRECSEDCALIVHTHLIDAEILSAICARDDAVLIWNHRDPRDALVSLMKLHEITLEWALKAMGVYCSAAATALTTQRCLEVRYTDLVSDLTVQIEMLAQALSVTLRTEETEALIERTSAAAHRKVMFALAEGTMPGMSEVPTRNRMLREDPKTLLNDRHIQSGKNGRWRTELSAEAQSRVQVELANWVKRFGYV
ncbi:MAG: sulfotransferase domain-containing protein [Pseudomonadota bacterium]